MLKKADFKQIMKFDQYDITKNKRFVGKMYVCDGIFKLIIYNKALNGSVYMFFSVNLVMFVYVIYI